MKITNRHIALIVIGLLALVIFSCLDGLLEWLLLALFWLLQVGLRFGGLILVIVIILVIIKKYHGGRNTPS